MNRFFIFGFAILFSSSAFSIEQHHNLSVNACRALPYGDLQVRGVSNLDSAERSITFAKANFNEKVIGHFLSLCMASLASSKALRIDYLDCNGTSCFTSNNTSVTFLK